MSSVSVLVPTFNAAAFIAETLSSALRQTLSPAEVIVVDDGSTDQTPEIVANFGPPVMLIRQRNGGAAKARNRAAACATGRWVAFLDADDLWEPRKLEKQLDRAGQSGQFVYSDRTNIGMLDGLARTQSHAQPMFEGHIFDRLLEANVITTSSVIMTRELFVSVGGFDEEPNLLPAEDWDLWLRCAARTEILLADEPLVQYRLHAGGISRSVHRMNRARSLVVNRALQLPIARSFSRAKVRRIRAELWRTIGWDLSRSHHPIAAGAALMRALALNPRRRSTYGDLLRLAGLRLE